MRYEKKGPPYVGYRLGIRREGGRGVYTFLTRRIRITVSSTEQLFNGARTRLPLHFIRYLVGRPSADQENALGDTLQYRVDSVYVCMYLYKYV